MDSVLVDCLKLETSRKFESYAGEELIINMKIFFCISIQLIKEIKIKNENMNICRNKELWVTPEKNFFLIEIPTFHALTSFSES